MTRPTDPRLALWLLERLGPHHESVAGDIAERWAVARMSRPVPGGMVLLFASVVMLAGMPGNYGLLQDALERSELWPRLMLFVSRDVIWALCVVAGGVWANTTPSVAAQATRRPATPR